MQHLFIDESGSMTTKALERQPYFVISVVQTDSPKRLGHLHTRFVRQKWEELRRCDWGGKMFCGEQFLELKGTCLSPELKEDLASRLCGKEAAVFYIVIDNRQIRGALYENTARAFNYVLKTALEYWIKAGYLPDDEYMLCLDERNEKTQTKHFLQAYLNTEFRMEGLLTHNVTVQYCDSTQDKRIQIADVLANLQYHQLFEQRFTNLFQQLREAGCLKHTFYFP